jgi:biotin operon repressor
MAGMKIASDVHIKIYELGQQSPKLTNSEIARALGIYRGTVAKLRDQSPTVPAVAVIPARDTIHDDIKRLLKKQPLSDVEIADSLDVSPKRIRDAVQEMASRGILLMQTVDGRHGLMDSIAIPPGKSSVAGNRGDWTHTFGVTSDNHLCNRNSRLEVLNAAYDHFEREGITTVYNAGNWIDGEARFNKSELIAAPGMDSQIDYMIDKWPVKKGITTHYVAGDDHEGWYQQREGIEIGKYLEMRAIEQGRDDLHYLGYGEADVALNYGSGSAIMRVVHPGGGSAYATSYTEQKLVESYQGGEKPHVILMGHYHKFNQGYPREVHTIQCGTTMDQSLFMRKKRLQAHVGFLVVKIKQDDAGAVSRMGVEFFPFYDKAYYQRFK